MGKSWLSKHIPPHRVYVEPFGGGAGLLFAKQRSYAEVYNDLDEEVVNFFRVLRDRPEDLARVVGLTPFARAEFDAAYEPTDDVLERARRLVIRSHMGFGSAAATRRHRTGFRSDTTRSRTHPAMDWTGMPDVIHAAAERFAGVVIECRDYPRVFGRYDAPDVLFYLDPPYVRSTRRLGSEEWRDSYRHEMDDVAHRALAERARALTAMVLLSGYHSPLYDELYHDWPKVEKVTYGQDHSGASARTEVLWMNPAAAAALERRDLFSEGEA